MKNLLFITSALFLLFSFYSCDDDTNYGNSVLLIADPYVNVVTDKVSFVAGSADYDIEFIIVPATTDATDLNVYKTFTDAATSETSNTVLLGKYNFDELKNSDVLKETIDFELLREGIIVGGNPLTNNENDIAVGSKWELTFEPVNANDEVSFITDKTIEVIVLSTFAGKYRVIESVYYRENTDQGISWVGEERFISSVDANTFSHPEWFGPFAYANPSSQFIFSIDETDNTITIPASIDGVSQPVSFGEYFVSCSDLGPDGDLSNVDCQSSNILIPDFLTGKHIIKLSYGYYASIGTAVVSTRQFYEVLEKVVE